MKVFISYTKEMATDIAGLGNLVEAAERGANAAGFVSKHMRDFTASPRPPAQVCRDAVSSCDVLVGLIGFRRGSQVPDLEPATSYVQLEFDTARKRNPPIPCLVFLLDEDAPVPHATFSDPHGDDRQSEFRRELQNSNITTARFRTPDGLQSAVRDALEDLGLARGSSGDRRGRASGLTFRVIIIAVSIALAVALILTYLNSRGDENQASGSHPNPIHSATAAPPTATRTPETPTVTVTRLGPGELLFPGQALVSPGGRYRAMLESDGNLHVRDLEGSVIWRTRAKPGGRKLTMQSDGSLVIHAVEKDPVWAAGGAPGTHLELADDGILKLRGPRGTEFWAGTYSNTLLCGQSLMPGKVIYSHNRLHSLEINDDGNLILSGPGGTTWESETAGHPGARLELRQDGYLAIYDKSNNEVSIENKPFPDAAFEDATLEVQNDGNLVLHSISHHAEWASGKPAA
jgi:hypothetical protein